MKLDDLKAMEADATPGPWTNAEVWCDQNSDSDSTTGWKAYEADAKFITTLRALAPELLAVWEAANRAGKLFNASMGTFDKNDDPTELTQEALDALHQGWIGFAETVNALNHKAAAL